MPRSLNNIFENQGSDKNRNGYTCVYDSLWKNIRDRPLKILEIGVGCTLLMGDNYQPGASLRAWAEYFPNASIVGTDIAPEVVNLEFMNGRVSTHECNSTIPQQVNSFIEKMRTKFDIPHGPLFDIIIDDGSHLEQHQIDTLFNLFPLLVDGGYYVLEDIGGDTRNLGYKSCSHFLPPRNTIKNIIGEHTHSFVVHDWIQHDSAMLVISK